MTYYFDSAHEKVRNIEKRVRRILDLENRDEPIPIEDLNWIWNEELESIETKLLFEVQLVATLSNFPAELSDKIQVAIAKYGSEPLAGVLRCSNESEDQMFQRIHNLIWNLHSVFHELGQLCLPEFSDKPDSILRARAATLEDRRLELMRANPDFADEVCRYDLMIARLNEDLMKP